MHDALKTLRNANDSGVPVKPGRMPSAVGDVPKGSNLQVRCLRLDDLGPAEIAAWRALDAQALEPSPYLSPEFLLPVMRHLDPQGEIVLAVVESTGPDGREMCALAPLRSTAASRYMPLTHCRLQPSLHSFLNGVLVRRMHAKRHLEALFDQGRRYMGHGIVLEACSVDGPTDALLRDIAAERGMRRVEIEGFERAGMCPAQMGEADLAARLPSRAKKLRSQMKKFAKFGEVNFRLWRGSEITDAVIERHMAIEHMGWKGENGSSLRSHPEHEDFFREMARGFAAENRALFAELWVGERVIASSSNLISGNVGAAFKIGFDPEFASLGPGIACELELMRCAPTALADVDFVDSGSVAGSYIEDLWPLRRRMATVSYSISPMGNLALLAMSQLRSIKRILRESSSASAPASAPVAVAEAH
jgi:CelD/BcsL family acetyltransferase involved in cellulose biosynthesis